MYDFVIKINVCLHRNPRWSIVGDISVSNNSWISWLLFLVKHFSQCCLNQCPLGTGAIKKYHFPVWPPSIGLALSFLLMCPRKYLSFGRILKTKQHHPLVNHCCWMVDEFFLCFFSHLIQYSYSSEDKKGSVEGKIVYLPHSTQLVWSPWVDQFFLVLASF